MVSMIRELECAAVRLFMIMREVNAGRGCVLEAGILRLSLQAEKASFDKHVMAAIYVITTEFSLRSCISHTHIRSTLFTQNWTKEVRQG